MVASGVLYEALGFELLRPVKFFKRVRGAPENLGRVKVHGLSGSVVWGSGSRVPEDLKGLGLAVVGEVQRVTR